MARKVSELVQRLPMLEDTVDHLLDYSLEKEAGRGAFLYMVKEDPGLALEMLFLANSACYSGRDRVSAETIEEAWERVDMKPLQMLVASQAVGMTDAAE
jgi:HD-like signal output (HDOD) protein